MITAAANKRGHPLQDGLGESVRFVASSFQICHQIIFGATRLSEINRRFP